MLLAPATVLAYWSARAMAEPTPAGTARFAKPPPLPPGTDESPFAAIEDYPIEEWATGGKSRDDTVVRGEQPAGIATATFGAPAERPRLRIDSNTGLVMDPVLPDLTPAPAPAPIAIQERTPGTTAITRRSDTAIPRNRTPLPDDLPAASGGGRGLDRSIRSQLVQAGKDEQEQKALALLRASGYFSEHVDYHGLIEANPRTGAGRVWLFVRQDGTLVSSRRLLALGYVAEEGQHILDKTEFYAPAEVERGLDAAADPGRSTLIELPCRVPRGDGGELPADPEGARIEMVSARRMFYLAGERVFTPRQWAAARRAWERRFLPRLTTPIADAISKTTRFFRKRS
jgi:hypothetical protein